MSPTATKEDFGAHAQNTTIITNFGGVEYCVNQPPAQIITFQPSRPSLELFGGLNGDLFPCTVIDLSKDQLNKDDLDAISAKFTLCDDVWTQAFLEGQTSLRREITISIFHDCEQPDIFQQ